MERYTRDHVWARAEGGFVRCGVSAFAQQELGDVAYVELPAVGRHVARGEAVCLIESLKSSTEIYAPVAGRVAEANGALADERGCAAVNRDPLGAGWLVLLQPDDPREIDGLLSRQQYERYLVESTSAAT